MPRIGPPWGWIIAIGFGLAVIAVVGFAAAVFLFARAMVVRSDAYRVCVDFLEANPVVIADVGTPMTEGWLPSGSVHTAGVSGEAELTVSLSGPRGQGQGALEARRIGGRWVVTSARWTHDDSTRALAVSAEPLSGPSPSGRFPVLPEH